MMSGPQASGKPRAVPTPTDGTGLIYRNVLDNVASGVMSLDSGGVITSFNAAAADIVGLPMESVVGRTIAEVFPQIDGVEEFIDVILDAVYDTRLGHQRVIETTFTGGKRRSLSVATSYLKEQRDGEAVKIGVVVIFTDVTEVKELRARELRLAKEVQGKHTELRNAYVTLEGRNRELSAALRKVRAVRIGAIVFALILLAGIGLYAWNVEPRIGAPTPAATASQPVEGELRTVVVKPGRVSSTITMVGQLAPRREVEVTSPINGKVAAIHFQYGERVFEGQRLVDMDVSDVRIERSEARVAHVRALERVRELEDWSNHVDVSRARRAVSKSRIELDARNNRVAETAFLLERGVIPASEHRAAERQYRNQELDLRSAQRDLEIVLAKGVTEGEVARLELATARARLERLEETINNAAIVAPVGGVVMHARGTSMGASAEDNPILARGASVTQGERLLTIGDLDGMTVVGRVDEVDVTKIRSGQPVRIIGEAFPGMELQGAIQRVSSQASRSDDMRRLPSFEVAALVESLTEGQRRLLRLGMSARLEVVVYDRADALMVPIGAVEVGDAGPRLRIRDKDTGAVLPVTVATGVTTLDGVEILEGIQAGDVIVVSGR